MEGLNFGPDGVLYASSGADSPNQALANSLFTIIREGPNAGQTIQVGSAAIPGTGDYEGSNCYFIQPEAFSTVSGTVFLDLSENGIRDNGETVLGGAEVWLWLDGDSNGVVDVVNDFVADTFITGVDGRYNFITPINERYIVQIQNFTTGEFCIFTTPTSAPIFVPNFCGVDEVAPDFGVSVCRVLGDYVWDDRDQNGVQDPGEPALSGVSVRLYDQANTRLDSGTNVTDATGFYLFDRLSNINYRVEFVLPATYLFTADTTGLDDTIDSDPNPLTGQTPLISLVARPPQLPANFGGRPETLYGITTIDAGMYQEGDVALSKVAEAPVPGIGSLSYSYRIAVTNLGIRVETNLVVNDALPNGLDYLGSSLGTYTASNRTWSVTIPTLNPGAGAEFTLQVAVTNTLVGVVQNTACVLNPIPEVNALNNCDSVTAAAIGNFVWNDLDADGIQDPGEPGIDGAVVNLLSAAGQTLASTITTNGGAYAFAGITPGTYIVESPIPSGLTTRRSPTNAGGDATADSDGDFVTGRSAPVTLLPGDNIDTLDFGFFAPFLVVTADPLCFNDTPYIDYTVQVTGASTNGGVTISFLSVGSTQVVSSTSGLPLSGRILYPGAAVDINGDPTDWPGWRFDGVNWVPENDGLRPTVQMLFVVNPELTAIVPYPDATPACVPEPVVSIGNRVFLDRDGSGSFNGADTGIAGVTVQLLSTGPDLVIGGGDDTPVDSDAFTPGVQSTTVTDANGYYLFSRVASGRYYTLVPAAQFQVGGALQGLVSSVGFGTDGITDEVLDENGVDNVDPTVNGITSVAITVAAANAPVADLDVGPLSGQADNSENLTLDFAFFVQPRVGDFVWNDTDRDGVQDPGEPGVDNVLVELLDNLGGVLATTTTTNGGQYGFTVNPGVYQIRFTPAAGTEFVAANLGGNPALDSDANPVSGLTPLFSLAAEQVELTLDAGLQDLLSGVVIQKTVAVGLGQPCPGSELVTVIAGQDVTYCFVVTNTGQTHLASTTLTDADITPNLVQSLGLLAPGQSVTVAVNNVANTDLLNTASVEGQPARPNGVPLANRPPVSRTDTSRVDVIGPAIDLRKSIYAGNLGVAGCEGLDFIAVTNGQTVTYCFVVTNTGDATLDNVVIADNALTPPVNLNVGSLAAGQSVTQSVATVATVDLVNTASATGIPPAGPPVSDQDPATVDVVNPGITIAKTVYLGQNGGASCATGLEEVSGTNNTAVTYCFVIRNTGDAPLANVSVTDNDVAPPFSAVIGGLPVGGVVTAFVERAITVDLLNTATATGTPPAGPPVAAIDTSRVRFIPVGSIGDFVWNDLNANGVQDPGEPGIPGVLVELQNLDTLALLVTTTDANGSYRFVNQTPANYLVGFGTPVGAVRTPQDQGGSDLTDSDIDANNQTPSFLMPGNVTDNSRDAGFYFPATISGQVRDDANGDGNLVDPDPALPGAFVELLPDVDCNQVADAGSPAVASQTTGANGQYSFANLVPGCYVVRETNPGGYQSTGDRTPPNDDLIPLTVISGQNSVGNDFLDMRPGVIGNFVWDDLNGNGLQDPGEPGIPNVTINLVNAANVVVATDVTDANGLYGFASVLPGTYRIGYLPATLPVGYLQTIAVPGSPANNSDPDPLTQLTAPIVITSGAVIQDQDLGVYGPITIGDFVWRDRNNNGVQDPGEAGIPGVTVTLFNATTSAQVGTPVVTDANGLYRFTGLVPGSYFVQFDVANRPAGTSVATANQGASDATDSDADANGLTPPTPFLVSNTTDTSLDLGLVPLGSIGDTVWYDVDGNGLPDERLFPITETTSTGRVDKPGLGLSGVTVELYVVGGLTPIQTTVTSTNSTNSGFYEFTGLRPAQYEVRVVRSTVPAYFTRSTTPVAITVDLVANLAVDTADFGFSTPSTAVELVDFSAVQEAGVVRLSWETGSETDNFGFNLYRSDRADGLLTQVNAALVEASGAGAGATYGHIDASVPAGIWYYWLEDVEFSGATKKHGPVRVLVKPLENQVFALAQDGLSLIAAGASGSRSNVEVDGVVVPSILEADGSLLFYAQAGAVEARVVPAAEPVRMTEQAAAPQGGETVVVVSEDGASVALGTIADAASYLAIGFAGADLLVLDVTDASAPRLLTGVEVLQTSSDSGAYFSQAGESARLVVQRRAAVRPLR